MNKKKVYCASGANGYASWLPRENWEITNKLNEASLVIFEGGADVSPYLYGEKQSKHTWTSPATEKRELIVWDFCQKNNIPSWGTCRGFQLMSALCGGKVIQDVNHSSGHYFIDYRGKEYVTNSLHHQLVYPYNLTEKEDYHILGYNPKMSDTHINGDDEEMILPENYVDVESAWFPKFNAIGVQFHPEMMPYSYAIVGWCREILDGFLNGTLIKDLNEVYSNKEKVIS